MLGVRLIVRVIRWEIRALDSREIRDRKCPIWAEEMVMLPAWVQ